MSLSHTLHSTCRFAHLCRAHPCGSIREQGRCYPSVWKLSAQDSERIRGQFVECRCFLCEVSWREASNGVTVWSVLMPFILIAREPNYIYAADERCLRSRA